MKALLILLTWFAVIEIKVLVDWYQIVKLKRGIIHWMEMIVVIAVAIFHGIYAADVKEANEWSLIVLFFQASSYWFFFDGLLSIHRGLNWFYVSRSPQSAKTDQFFSNAFGLYIASKVIALILMGFTVVFIFQGQ